MTASSTRVNKHRVEAFGPVLPGDVVKLRGEHGTFRFLSAVHDGDDGPVLWIDLHGGRPHHEKLRSVRPDRVKFPTARELARQRRAREDA